MLDIAASPRALVAGTRLLRPMGRSGGALSLEFRNTEAPDDRCVYRKPKPGRSDDEVHPRLGDKECVRRDRRRARPVHLSPGIDACGSHCTTRFENAHRTVLREVLYRHHPWFGRRVCIHGAVDKDGFVVFRRTLEELQADRGLEVPAWMFDRTACPEQQPNLAYLRSRCRAPPRRHRSNPVAGSSHPCVADRHPVLADGFNGCWNIGVGVT